MATTSPTSKPKPTPISHWIATHRGHWASKTREEKQALLDRFNPFKKDVLRSITKEDIQNIDAFSDTL